MYFDPVFWGLSEEFLEGYYTYKPEKICYNRLVSLQKNERRSKMAKRRMLSIDVIESDSFCTLKASAQVLYLHLNMNADDDGVVDNWKSILRYLRIKREHLDALIRAGLVIELESGALLVSDWLIHNKIRKDRYYEGQHSLEVDALKILPTGRYFKGL